MTSFRKLTLETSIVWFIFFYLSLGWNQLAQANPERLEVPMPMQPFNEFLKFFLIAFIMLAIGLVQVVLEMVLRHCLGLLDDPETLNFADLCTLANCSVLILTDKYHGYYIHGKAPWSKSDLPMSWLKMELDHEADNKHKSRAYGREAG